jgi:peptidoglycan/LPS O-acetylase OafA/YrhL
MVIECPELWDERSFNTWGPMLEQTIPQNRDDIIEHQLSGLPSPQPQIVPPFDGLLALRGLACSIVILMHCLSPAVRKTLQVRNIDFSWIFFGHGFAGVWIFFTLSGYLMGKAFFTQRYDLSYQGFSKFYRNRAIRIFPLYYFVLFFQTILVYPNALRIENWGYMLKPLTFTLALVPGNLVNGSLWSLSTEVQFYLLVPFIFLATRKLVHRSKLFVLVVMLGVAVSFIGIRGLIWYSLRDAMLADFWLYVRHIYYPLVTNLDLFLLGFLMNALFQNQHVGKPGHLGIFGYLPRKVSKAWGRLHQWIRANCHLLGILLIAVFYLATSHHLYFQEQWNSPTRSFTGFRTAMTSLFLPSLTALVVCLFIGAFEGWGQSEYRMAALSPSILLKQPIRCVEILGILSYGLYVWHIPILEHIRPIFSDPFPLISFFRFVTATFVLSGITATITYYLVERAALKWKISVNSDSTSSSKPSS